MKTQQAMPTGKPRQTKKKYYVKCSVDTPQAIARNEGNAWYIVELDSKAEQDDFLDWCLMGALNKKARIIAESNALVKRLGIPLNLITDSAAK